jgi:uncharacterized membrane protein
MGGMMGGAGMGAWMLLWVLVGITVAVTGGVLVALALVARRGPQAARLTAGDGAAVREARDALKSRYARGDISREEYLQGKVELEDFAER